MKGGRGGSRLFKGRGCFTSAAMNRNDKCEIMENTRIAQDMYKMAFLSQHTAITARPGQFVHIKVPYDNSMILRRPISIHDVHPATGRVEIAYRVAGKGTRILSEMGPGQHIDVLGPLGNGFDISRGIKSAFVIGGGCGVAPLKFLVRRLNEEGVGVTALLGFRSRRHAYQLDEFNGFSNCLMVCTDDGSLGRKGPVTQALAEALGRHKPDVMFACGPLAMLRAVQGLAVEYGVRCQMSLEERMGCGIGGCLVCSCAIRTSDGGFEYKRVCKDGPVFWSHEVMLDDSKTGC